MSHCESEDAAVEKRVEDDSPSEIKPVSGSPWRAPGADCDGPRGGGSSGNPKFMSVGKIQ